MYKDDINIGYKVMTIIGENENLAAYTFWMDKCVHSLHFSKYQEAEGLCDMISLPFCRHTPRTISKTFSEERWQLKSPNLTIIWLIYIFGPERYDFDFSLHLLIHKKDNRGIFLFVAKLICILQIKTQIETDYAQLVLKIWFFKYQ